MPTIYRRGLLASSVSTFYSYTFTGSNGASWESGWNTAGTGVSAVDIQSNTGRVLLDGVSFSSAGAYFNGLTIPQDFTLTVDLTLQSVNGGQLSFAVNVRAAGTSFLQINQYSSWNFLLSETAVGQARRVDGSGGVTALTSGSDKGSFTSGDVIHFKVAPLGTHHRVKYWFNSDPEPGSWDIDYDDGGSAPTGSMISLMCRNGTPTGYDYRWDNLLITVP